MLWIVVVIAICVNSVDWLLCIWCGWLLVVLVACCYANFVYSDYCGWLCCSWFGLMIVADG